MYIYIPLSYSNEDARMKEGKNIVVDDHFEHSTFLDNQYESSL